MSGGLIIYRFGDSQATSSDNEMFKFNQLWKVLVLLANIAFWTPERLAISGSADDAHEVLKRGTIEAGLSVGYWQGTTLVGNATSPDRSAVMILPRVGMVLTDPIGSSWWQGNVEVLLEPLYARFYRPFSADMAGGSLVVKYNLLSFGRWIPFWDIGGGMVWTNLAPQIPEESTPFLFTFETGPGVNYLVTNTLALTGGVRYSHFSNGDIGTRNTGLNGFLFYVGFSFFLPH